jgi:hypothetical protein
MNGELALSTIKSFKSIMSQEDFDVFVKGDDSEKLRSFPEVQEFLKGEEKPEGGEKAEGEEEPEKEETEEKGVTAEMLKSLDTKLDGIVTILKGVVSDRSSDEIAEIRKSITDINDSLESLKGMPQGKKAIKNGSAEFFQKSLNGEMPEDEKGKKVLSITLNKEQVLKALENGFEKTQDEDLKKSYESSIVRYNGGGGTISQDVAIDMYEKHNVRLTR